MNKPAENEILLNEAQTPDTIETASFAIIEEEIPEPRPFSGHAWQVARRIIHAAGDITILADLVLPDASVQAGITALAGGASIFTDTEMAKAGIPLRRITPLGCKVECVLSMNGLEHTAMEHGITRTRAGFLTLGSRLAGSIVVIGNAPTALLAVLDHVKAGGSPPALVIGMPVGFVNAAESKALLERNNDINYLTLRGRRGGSALAAAAVNALAEILLQFPDRS